MRAGAGNATRRTARMTLFGLLFLGRQKRARIWVVTEETGWNR
jgi:hypothetical protein